MEVEIPHNGTASTGVNKTWHPDWWLETDIFRGKEIAEWMLNWPGAPEIWNIGGYGKAFTPADEKIYESYMEDTKQCRKEMVAQVIQTWRLQNLPSNRIYSSVM